MSLSTKGFYMTKNEIIVFSSIKKESDVNICLTKRTKQMKKECTHLCRTLNLIYSNENREKGVNLFVNKLIIDTRTKFSIYARRAFRLQKTHQ